MRIAARIVPSATVAVLALLGVLPWGLPADGRFVLPFLPVIAIYYWAARDAECLPAWVPFATGLWVDVISNGPLGFWPLVYLGGHLLGAEARRAFGTAEQWARFALALSALLLLAWVIVSAYDFAWADWRPFAWAGWCVMLAFPLLVPVLRLLDPGPVRPSNDRFARGI